MSQDKPTSERLSPEMSDAANRRLRAENERLRAENERLQTEIGQLQAEVEQLRTELKRLKAHSDEIEQKVREAHRQTAPFRRRETLKKPAEQKKRPGRKKGHPPAYRQKPQTVDHEETVPLPGCPHCHAELQDVRENIQYLEEIPPIKPVVVKVTTYVGTCSRCGEVRSTHPLQTSTATGAAGTHLGPRAQALAVSLCHGSGLSMRRACRTLETLCGLKLSPGGLAQLMHRAARRLGGWFDDIVDRIRNSAAVFADETSWYVGEPKWWLWVFTTPDTTLFRVESGRGSDVVRKTLTDEFQGILVSDCLSSYDPIDCRKHKCVAHHLRALAECDEKLKKRGIESPYLQAWKFHLKDVIWAWKCRNKMTEVDYAAKVAQLLRGNRNLLENSPSEGEEAAFRNRMLKQRDHLLGCLQDPAAEPTNNRAERDLRPAVIDRKLSCGNRTEVGKRTWETLRSVVTTMSKRGLDVVDELTRHLRLAPD